MEEIKALLKALIASNKMDEEKKEDNKKAANEDVDKRKLIDEVAGMMKSAVSESFPSQAF